MICQNTTMRVYRTCIKRCCVLCPKYIAPWAFVITSARSRHATRGACMRLVVVSSGRCSVICSVSHYQPIYDKSSGRILGVIPRPARNIGWRYATGDTYFESLLAPGMTLTVTGWFTISSDVHDSYNRRHVLRIKSSSRHKLSTLKIFSWVVKTVQWLATMTHGSSTGRLENNHPEYPTTDPFKWPAKWRHQLLCIWPVSLTYHIRPSFVFKIPPKGFRIPLNYSCWPTWPKLILLKSFPELLTLHELF